MREPTIARNYAEALFQLGERAGQTNRYANLMGAVAASIEEEEKIRDVLESPRVSKQQKQSIFSRALEGYAPVQFIRFLEAVIKRDRQGILGAIAKQYLALVDDKFDRVHAAVTLARKPDQTLREIIRRRLSEIVGKEVIPHFRQDREIIGGLVVRVGDRIMDGSLRRKMVTLRRTLLNA